jgi:hypothetical protein
MVVAKTIKLDKEKETIIDDEDYESLIQYDWRYDNVGTSNEYARRRGFPGEGKSGGIFMHRLIMKANKGDLVDHINGDGLDNRKNNLRLSTKSTNGMNRGKQQNNKSGYKGVSWCKKGKKWTARIKSKEIGKYLFLGYFESKEAAASAYNEAAKKYHKEFAFINKI